MHELNIDAEFRDLCQPLTTEQFETLEANINADGIITDPIICWNGTIIDGHNRYAIAEKHGLTFQVEDWHFEHRDDVKKWIVDHQLGRRNLTPKQAAYLRGKLYEAEKAEHGGEREGAGKKPAEQTTVEPAADSSAQNAHLKSSAKSAKSRGAKDGVDQATVRRDEEYAKAVDAIGELDAELRRQIQSGEFKVTKKRVTEAGKLIAEGKLDLFELRDFLENKKPPVVPPVESLDIKELARPFAQWSRELSAMVRELEGMQEHARLGPHVVDPLRRIRADVRNIKDALSALKPAAVCDLCNGKGCNRCKHTGILTALIHDQSKRQGGGDDDQQLST